MKPGCFLKTIIILTILVAAIMYIIQHKSDIFFKQGKKIIAEAILDDWDREFNYVKDTPEKSELKDSLWSYIENIKPQNIPDDKKIDSIMNMVRSAALDSIISKAELKEISKDLLLLKNERPE